MAPAGDWLTKCHVGSVLWVGGSDQKALHPDGALSSHDVDIRFAAFHDGELAVDPATSDSKETMRYDVAVLGVPWSSMASPRLSVHAVCEKSSAVLVGPVTRGYDAERDSTFAECGYFGYERCEESSDPRVAQLPAGFILYKSLRLSTADDLEVGDIEDRYEAAMKEYQELAERFNQLAAEHHDLARAKRGVEVELEAVTVELERLREVVTRHTSEIETAELRRRAEVTSLTAALFRLEKEVSAGVEEAQRLRVVNAAAIAELEALQHTKVFRYSRLFRRGYAALRRGPSGRSGKGAADLVNASLLADDGSDPAGTYEEWIRLYDTLDAPRRERISAELARCGEQPLVSVLMPVHDPPLEYLRRAIASVQEQIYENWQLCIVDDASADPSVIALLAEYRDSGDGRIRVNRRTESGHIAAASNSALELAEGEWVVPLDHDDELAPHALATAVLASKKHSSAALVYSDEDKIDDAGVRHAPFFKPDFDPLRILGQNYVCHMVMARRQVVERAGRFRLGTEGSQDWDLLLRIVELVGADRIVHVPHVLYHWRSHDSSMAGNLSSKPYAISAGGRVVTDHLKRRNLEADTITNSATGLVRVKWRLPKKVPKVSIVIPTRDGSYLPQCIESILRGTGYADYDVVVVDNGSTSADTLRYLRGHDSWLKVVRDERPFNYSALNNTAVAHCDGDVLCLLNDDCEIIHHDWLEEMVGQLLQDGVGAVGAKLLYGDGRIQHGGVVLGVGGVAGHAHKLEDRHSRGYFDGLRVAHSMSAVTAACMVVWKRAYEEVGGLDETNQPIAFNDVDFCMKLGAAGWRIVWTPYAELTHHESVSRGGEEGPRAEEFAREIASMQGRWGERLRSDPYYNPNLTLEHEHFGLAFPPRCPI